MRVSVGEKPKVVYEDGSTTKVLFCGRDGFAWWCPRLRSRASARFERANNREPSANQEGFNTLNYPAPRAVVVATGCLVKQGIRMHSVQQYPRRNARETSYLHKTDNQGQFDAHRAIEN